MKNLFVLFVTMFTLAMCSSSMYAQVSQQQKITVNTSDLTPDQLAKIKAEQELAVISKKMEQYGNWVGIGGEIGQAIKDGLYAVKDVAVEFGGTSVGKFTMYLIAWKVMGKDIVRIFLGLIFILVATIVIWKSYKLNFCARRIKVKDNGWRVWLPNEYSIIEPKTFDGINLVRVLIWFILIGVFGLTYAIMFG